MARFNALLARELGVPLIGIFDPSVLSFKQPLLSLKASEFEPAELMHLERRLDEIGATQAPRVFLHAFTDTRVERKMLAAASTVYCGNRELVAQVAPLRPDAVEVWCPGTILSHDRFQPVELSVLSFGMAHKVRSEYYSRLHDLLEQTGQEYCLYLSTALHENTSFEESFNGAFDGIRQLFGDRVHFLGFLSDAAVYNYVLDSTYLAAFFQTGVRSNNTSVNAAMACGAVVITNLDEYSPLAFEHGVNVLDIQRLTTLPSDRQTLAAISDRARDTASGILGWPALMTRIRTTEADLERMPQGTLHTIQARGGA